MQKATCQVCGREIKATGGSIAHHGYKRPYQQGWQTASCPGAKYAPYEVSCDRLKEVIDEVREFIAVQEKEQAAFLENPPQTIKVFEKRSAWQDGQFVEYTKPEVFDKDRYYGIPRTYASAYAQKKYEYERTIEYAKADLSRMERRLSEWKGVNPSEEWFTGTHTIQNRTYVFYSNGVTSVDLACVLRTGYTEATHRAVLATNNLDNRRAISRPLDLSMSN